MRKQTISFFIFIFAVFAVNASVPAPKLFTGSVSPLVVESNVTISAHYEYSGKKVGRAAWDIAKSPYALGNAAGTLMFDSNAREELIERLALAKELFERYKNDPCFRDEVNKKLGKEAADYFSDPDKISDLLITGGTGILAGAGISAASKSAKAEQMLQKLSRLMKKMGGKAGKVGVPKAAAVQKFYPKNQGFLGQTQRQFLEKGQMIDRYGGSSSSRFFSPAGTPEATRALPPGTSGQPLRTFEVVKPFEVDAGTVAPAFGQSGFGTQFRTPVPMETLLKRGIIREVMP